MKRFCIPLAKVMAPKVIALVCLMFLTMLPFAGALEIHHIFSEVDHDAHEHTEFDLCQWVQQHGNGLFEFQEPVLDRWPLDDAHKNIDHETVLVSFLGLSIHSPRPPPFFL